MAATRKKIPLITEDATLNIAAGKTLDISGADVSIVGSGAAVITFPSTTSTLAKITDITGTNSNTNTGDQTSIVGITGTKAQFDTAVTDGNITYDGDAPTAHKASHEDGGADEISIAGLAGTPADLSTHESDTTTHGTTGDIVGTTDTQTLTNKTIDGNNNTITNVGGESINNLLKNGNFINASTDGYGGLADDWVDDGNANPVQGGFPSMTKQELIDLLGVTDANIEGLWNLNEASGNAIDLSSNSYDLTDTNSVLYSADGLMGNARDYELTNAEYHTIADASCANLEISGSQTWIAFIKPESVGSQAHFIGKSNTTPNNFARLFLSSGNAFIFNLEGLTTNTGVTSDILAEAGKWYMVVGVYDSTNSKLKIWVNGVKKEVSASGSHSDTNGDFSIGRLGGWTSAASNYFDGLIQNACIINGALTDTQVKKLWAYTTYKGTKIRRATTNGVLSQDLPQNLVESLRGKDVSIVSKMYQDTASIGTVEIDDGGTPAESTPVATVDEFVEMGVTKTIDSDAQQIQLKLKVSDSDGNVWFKEVAVYEGSTLVYTWYPSYDDTNRFPRLLDMNPPASPDGYSFEENRWFSWTPVFSGQASMTWTSITVNISKFRVSGKTVFFVVDGSGVTGGTASFALYITLPINSIDYAGYFGGSLLLPTISAVGIIQTNVTNLQIFNLAAANFPLASGVQVKTSGFYEMA